MSDRRLTLISLLLTGCGYLPQINPVPTVTVTATVTATPEAKAPAAVEPIASPNPSPKVLPQAKDTYEIRYEGKAGISATGMYSIHKRDDFSAGQIEEVKGVLPFSVKLELPNNASVGASLHTFEDNVKPKVFIRKNGKECGKVLFSGSAIPDPESSKACLPDDATP
jgi:hypothetical protein